MSESGVQFELERAITGNELALHYQPRVLLSDLRLRGVEALVRWRHPVRGIVPPSEFIDLAAAERGGSMRDLQAWVIRESLLQAGVWRRDGLRVGMSVNITLPLLHDEPFLKLFERTLTIHGDPETFIVEVAAAALGGAERPVAGLARLRERGVRLALDDVTDRAGLDAASWSRWDYVKLGRRLVSGAARDPAEEALLRALVARSTELGARVQAVGAEDDDTIALLRDAGVYSVQGYAISRPLGVKELDEWAEGRMRRG